MPDRYALFGHPLAHTKSPMIHGAFARDTGQDLSYEAIEAPVGGFAAAVDAFRARGGRGINVTQPFKVDAFEYATELCARAKAAGAVNCMKVEGARAIAENFDGVGLVNDIERNLGFALAGKRVLMMGAGGAARGVVFGLLQRGARVTVLNRTPARAATLARELGAHGSGDLGAIGKARFDVLVNTTSAGLRSDESPVPAAAIPADALVMDAVYEPERTRLLRDAEACGARTIGGKWMLVLQAAEQFRLWTGREAPVDVMATAFDRVSPRG